MLVHRDVYLNGHLMAQGPDRDFYRRDGVLCFRFPLKRADVILARIYFLGLLVRAREVPVASCLWQNTLSDEPERMLMRAGN